MYKGLEEYRYFLHNSICGDKHVQLGTDLAKKHIPCSKIRTGRFSANLDSSSEIVRTACQIWVVSLCQFFLLLLFLSLLPFLLFWFLPLPPLPALPPPLLFVLIFTSSPSTSHRFLCAAINSVCMVVCILQRCHPHSKLADRVPHRASCL